MVVNRIMKDGKKIIGLSNSLFGHEKNSTKDRNKSTIDFTSIPLSARRVPIKPSRYRRADGGRGGQAGLLLGQAGLAAGFYSALPRHGSRRVIAAPRSMARQALPRQRSAIPVVATSYLCRATMHGVGRARTIDAAKSVSLKK